MFVRRGEALGVAVGSAAARVAGGARVVLGAGGARRRRAGRRQRRGAAAAAGRAAARRSGAGPRARRQHQAARRTAGYASPRPRRLSPPAPAHVPPLQPRRRPRRPRLWSASVWLATRAVPCRSARPRPRGCCATCTGAWTQSPLSAGATSTAATRWSSSLTGGVRFRATRFNETEYRFYCFAVDN